MPHLRHNWKVFQEKAVAYFTKQDGQMGSTIYAQGTAFECTVCKKLIFDPDDLKLHTVELEQGIRLIK